MSLPIVIAKNVDTARRISRQFPTHVAVEPPVRVLHVYKSWSADAYGGIEGFLSTLGSTARRYGIDTRIMYLAPGKQVRRVRRDGIAAYRFPQDYQVASMGISWSLLMAYRRLTAWADVLHFHFPWPYGDLVHLVTGVRKPFVVTYHSDVVRQRSLNCLYAPLRHWFLNRAARVIATSQNYMRTSPVLRRLGHTTRVIPLGMEDAGRGTGVPLRTAYWRHRLGENFVLFIGILRYYKGLEILLRAARDIHARIVIAGSGPCECALRAQAKMLGLNNVIFVGEVDPLDKDALFRLSALFVFPSHWRSEAFGLSLVEAAMYGKAQVSCDLGTGTTFINVHEQTGLVVEPGNPQALSAAVNRLLGDRRERELFGRNGRKRYLELFTADRMAEAYAAEYRHVATEARAWKP
jgi:O-antigen biosynthesis rhamnosyltransferase